MALGVDEGGEPVMRDYVLVGQVLRLEVEVVLSALRFVPNIGWSVLPTGRCATVGLGTFDNKWVVSLGTSVSGNLLRDTLHCLTNPV